MDTTRLLKFKDFRNNNYFYDYWENRILHINDCLKEILYLYGKHSITEIISILNANFQKEEIILNYNKAKKVDATNDYIQKLKSRILTNPNEFLPIVRRENIQQSIANIKQLTFEISQSCNFRCKYCVYSGVYKHQRDHSNKIMSFDIARKSIDYFFSLVNSESRTLKYDNIYFGFYGGEPLLGFELIKKIVHYIKAIETKETLIFSITTNGSLLTDEKIDFFIDNNFSLIISLDGPREENDKFRRYKNNKGTFDDIWSNISRIKARGKNFFNKNVSFSTSYCSGHNILKTDAFFDDNFKSNRIKIAAIRPDETTFFSSIKPCNSFLQDLNTLNEKYISAIKEDKHISPFSRELFSDPLADIFNRDLSNIEERILDKNRIFNVTSTCIPGGEKLFVSADGIFYICERVNRYFSIGNVNSGIDFKKIKRIMQQYSRFIMKECIFCKAKKFCGLCISHHNKKNGFDFFGYCKSYRDNMPKILSTYVNLYLWNKVSLIKNLQARKIKK